MAAAKAMGPGCVSHLPRRTGPTVARGSGRQLWSSANSLSSRAVPLSQSFVQDQKPQSCRVVSVEYSTKDGETESEPESQLGHMVSTILQF